jgi:DNA polymerase III epsilon subunit-like protein
MTEGYRTGVPGGRECHSPGVPFMAMSTAGLGIYRQRARGERASTGYLVLDIETTGLGDGCRIVEFAALVLDGEGVLVDRYETLIDPGSAPGPTRLHGIDAVMLQAAPRFVDVAGEIQRLFRDRVPVAHNLRFDWRALRCAYERLGVDLPPTTAGVCTARLSRRIVGGPCSLVQVCRRLGIDHTEPHRAGPDAMATLQVFRALCEVEPSIAQRRPCPVFAGVWRLPRSVPPVPRPSLDNSTGRGQESRLGERKGPDVG